MRIFKVSFDLALAALVGVVTCVAIAVTEQPGTEPYVRAPDALAYVLGGLIGALLLWRRRWPLGVLAGSSLVLLAYYALEYPGITPAVPLSAALFTAAYAGRFGWALGVVGAWVGLGVFMRLAHLREPFLSMASGMVEQAALLTVVVLFGHTLRVQGERAELAATRERLRLARDMHDVLGHTITAIGIQAAYADDIMETKPQRAREAIAAIRSEAKRAVTELRDAVEARLDPDLGRLLATARAAGLRVSSSIEPGGHPIAYRLVQEALTNTIRHANATSVTVRVSKNLVEVIDDGVGADTVVFGQGLHGMAARVAELGGRLEVTGSPGFRVRATIPG